jgi:hypothetical protein
MMTTIARSCSRPTTLTIRSSKRVLVVAVLCLLPRTVLFAGGNSGTNEITDVGYCEILQQHEIYDGRWVASGGLVFPTPHAAHLLDLGCSPSGMGSTEIRFLPQSDVDTDSQKLKKRLAKILGKRSASGGPVCATVSFVGEFHSRNSTEATFRIDITRLLSVSRSACPRFRVEPK